MLKNISLAMLAFFAFSSPLWAQINNCPNCIRSGIELVNNGDFSQGNTGFNSSYTFLQGPANIMNEGFYTVIDNPNAIHSGYTACPDHTTGNGEQMVINGATQPNVTLWCQTITVNPNTDYLFSTWVQSVVGSNPAQLQFSINGVNLGTVFSPSGSVCQWSEFFTVWNSGVATIANICIVNQNTQAGGNDFALDDISFMECVPIQPLNASVLYDDATCFGSNNGLATPNSGQAWGGIPPYSYTWFDGTTDITKDSLAPGNYFLVVTDSIGCVDTATFTISSAPEFNISLGPDTTICFGLSYTLQNLDPSVPPTGAIYAWNTGATTPTITADTSGQYILCATISNCTKCDTANIIISPAFTVNIGPADTTICQGGSLILNAGNPGAQYLWNTGLPDTTYLLTVDSAGIYWVQVSFDSLCVQSDTIVVGEVPCNSFVGVPNVFTPNGDGKNDTFTIIVGGLVTDVKMLIYNRWGNLLFTGEGPMLAWDGKYNNQEVSDGVYFYILTYIDNNGLGQQQTGTVSKVSGQ